MGDEEKEIQFMTEVENVDELNGNDKGEVPRIVDNEKDGGKFDVEPEEEGMREAMDEDEVATLEKVEVEDDKGDAMVEDENEPNEEREYDDEDDLEEEEDSEQESLKKLISKGRTKSVKKDTTTKGEVKGQKDKEPKTPAPPKTPAIERSQRERKSVDRLVSTFEKAKKFEVEKGLGTALKDIPNVQYNLSKKKWDESFKLLHLMLFARRGKAGKYKTNIARFSGVAWNDNEEKQKMKLKERFHKCARGKLLEFCNILDITGVKSTSKKEDIVAKLIEFVKAPHATRDQLMAKIEHGKKRKRVGKKGSSASKGSSSKNSSKKQKKTEKAFKNGKVKKFSISLEDESSSSEEEKTHEETDSGVPDILDDVMSNQTESDTEIKVKKSSTRKESAGKASKKVVSQKSGQAESEKGVESEDEQKKKKEPRKSSAKKEFSGNAPNKVVLQESGLAESENEERSEDESEEIVKKKESARKDSADNAAKKVVSQKCDKVEREDSGDELEEEKAKERVSKKSSAKKESAGRTAKKVGPQKSDQAESDDSGDESEEEEEEAEEEEEENVQEKEPKESSTKKESAGKAAKEVVPHKSSLPKTVPNRISSSRPKAKEDTNKSAKGSTKRKGKMLTKGKENPKEEKLVPSDDELRYAISNILKEVDLHSATFIDIVKQLVKRFEGDLMSRKATIRLMIQDELANQTDESEDEDEDSQEKLSAESVKT